MLNVNEIILGTHTHTYTITHSSLLFFSISFLVSSSSINQFIAFSFWINLIRMQKFYNLNNLKEFIAHHMASFQTFILQFLIFRIQNLSCAVRKEYYYHACNIHCFLLTFGACLLLVCDGKKCIKSSKK